MTMSMMTRVVRFTVARHERDREGPLTNRRVDLVIS